MHSFYIIDSYLDSLCKLIRQLRATLLFVKEARSNVEMQIRSYLAHWNDTEFRNALLVIGKEEGQYYKPNHQSILSLLSRSETACWKT